MREHIQPKATAQLKTTEDSKEMVAYPIAGRIGAEIVGLDLRQNLSESIIREIRQALIKYKVIFFRGQHLSPEAQIAFAQQFGELTTAHPSLPSLPNYPEILEFDYGRKAGRTNQWHTDLTFIDRPPLASILQGVEIPPLGGDTLWANTVTAYQDLPAPLRHLADQLWAVHSNGYTDYQKAAVNTPGKRQEFQGVFTSTIYETIHPVVRVHPESGERGLFIGAFVRQFQELSVEETMAIHKLLQSYVFRPENTVRWHWQEGDIAFWDNRVTQHYGIDDFGDSPRRVQRVTLVGDLPVGIDGRTSEAIRGDSSIYNKDVQVN